MRIQINKIFTKMGKLSRRKKKRYLLNIEIFKELDLESRKPNVVLLFWGKASIQTSVEDIIFYDRDDDKNGILIHFKNGLVLELNKVTISYLKIKDIDNLIRIESRSEEKDPSVPVLVISK